MKPVYHPTDINNFKITREQKEFVMENNFTKKELLNYLSEQKSKYYSKCQPIGFI